MRSSLGIKTSFPSKSKNDMEPIRCLTTDVVEMEERRLERIMTIELQILDFIQNHLRNGVMDVVMKTISFLGTGGAIWLLLAALMFFKKDTRIASVSMCLAIGIGVIVCSVIIKPIVARLRPCDVNTAVQLLVSRPHDYSFPSGHTTAAFAAAACLLFCANKWWPYFMVFAVIMAFSRLYLYVHFPTDVLAGCALGFICGWAGYKLGRLPLWEKLLNLQK
jgi:undecaprenyl-diphosphatase